MKLEDTHAVDSKGQVWPPDAFVAVPDASYLLSGGITKHPQQALEAAEQSGVELDLEAGKPITELQNSLLIEGETGAVYRVDQVRWTELTDEELEASETGTLELAAYQRGEPARVPEDYTD